MDGVDLELSALVPDQSSILVPEHPRSFDRFDQAADVLRHFEVAYLDSDLPDRALPPTEIVTMSPIRPSPSAIAPITCASFPDRWGTCTR